MFINQNLKMLSHDEFVVKKVTKTYSAKRTKIDKIDTNAI
jgi:hypothetical protein